MLASSNFKGNKRDKLTRLIILSLRNLLIMLPAFSGLCDRGTSKSLLAHLVSLGREALMAVFPGSRRLGFLLGAALAVGGGGGSLIGGFLGRGVGDAGRLSILAG
ncbi:hypothetical protein BDV23DRAFT_58970 [Aspergillus alliaceus]|uniref:Uncharacterized protein n=1 Tax=Petromyces alliaceus TaxID=209559 RepID=A0A5N7CDJ2_PETAA|nr:hypothetical protein BDV23DRAFT_58970 [Aspergillus alliaceus]